MKIVKRIIIFSGIAILILIALACIFISPVAEYLIEKNSVEYTGRKIEMGNLRINLLNGGLSISKLTLFESDQETVFLSAESISTRIKIIKAISGKYDIPYLKLNNLYANIKQDGANFNFDDVINKFSSSNTTTNQESEVLEESNTVSEPTQWWIKNIALNNASLVYDNANPKNRIQLDSLTITSDGIQWDNNDYLFHINTQFASGGNLKSDFGININSLLYNTQLDIQNLNITILLPYMTDYMFVEKMDGLLNTKLHVSGNGNEASDIAISGLIALNNFVLIDTSGEKLAALSSLEIGIDTVDTKAGLYDLKKLICLEPYIKFAMYEDGYNFDRLTTHTASSNDSENLEESTIDSTVNNSEVVYVDEYGNVFTMMADYIKLIAEQYAVNTYSADTILLSSGDIIYTDYTLEDKFEYDMDSVSISASKLSSENEFIVFHLFSRINNTALTEGNLAVSTENMNNMEITYRVTGFKMSDINPYSLYYLATPFMNGNVSFENETSIYNNKLKSSNVLLIEDVDVGERIINNPRYKLPIKFALFLLTDLNNTIRIEVPVEGDLNDPNYKWGKAIWQVVENILIKAVTAPYRLLANAFGGNEDDYKELRFVYLQEILGKTQMDVLNNIAKVLEAKPGLQIQFEQVINEEAEAERLAVQMVKSKFLGYKRFGDNQEDEMEKIKAVSMMDSVFVAYVNNLFGGEVALTSTQQKCMAIIGREDVFAALQKLIDNRNAAITNYLITEKQITADRIVLINKSERYKATELDVPKYMIEYSMDADEMDTYAADDSVQ